MERPSSSVSEPSAPQDAPAYDYGSFSGYRSSFSNYNQHSSLETLPISRNFHGGSLDTLPIGHGGYSGTLPISRDSHGGYADTLPISRDGHGDYSGLLNKKIVKEFAGDGNFENYSYTSSFDDLHRRHGYGSDAGTYLSGPYRGGAFDVKSASDYESHHRSFTTRPMSGFPQDVGNPYAGSESASRHVTTAERWVGDSLYDKMGPQEIDREYMIKQGCMSYEQPVSGGWQNSKREFSYPLRDYGAHYEQSPSAFHATQDRATTARYDDKSSYLLESKYGRSPSGSNLPYPGPWSSWRSAGGFQGTEEEHEWKGSSSFSSMKHESNDLNRVASSAYAASRDYNEVSKWKDESAWHTQLDAGQKGCESSLPHGNHVAKIIESKDASMKGQGVALPKSAVEEKKRRSRWGPVVESANGSLDGTVRHKKKSRWAAEKSPEKEISKPDILKEISPSCSDIVALKARLIIIEKLLVGGQVLENLSAERSPSPEPVFDSFGFRLNTREQRAREKLNKERQRIMARLEHLALTSKPAEVKLSRLFKKIYIPVDKFPYYNFVGLIIGPRGNTLKQMEKESGAKIYIRGKGSSKGGALTPGVPEGNESLHVLIEADNEDCRKKATEMVEKLLIPVDDALNEHKQAQLRELASLNGTLRPNELCPKCKGGHLLKDCHLLSITAVVEKGGRAAGSSTEAVQEGEAVADSDCKESPTNHENGNTVLYVESLPTAVDDTQLSHLFSPFGKIVHAKVVTHPTGASQRYGFVKFLDAVDAAQAVALMNGYRMDGTVLVVKLKTKAEPPS